MDSKKSRLISFKQRDQDNLKVGPSPQTQVPTWVLSGADLDRKTKFLIEKLDVIENNFPRFSTQELPDVLSVSFIEDAKAKTHQRKILDLMGSELNGRQIGMSDDNSILLEFLSKDGIAKIKENIDSDQEKYKVSISAIEDFTPYKAKKNLNEKNKNNYLLEFFDYSDKKMNENTFKYVEHLLKKNNIKFEEKIYNEDILLQIDNSSIKDALNLVENDSIPIKSINPIAKTEVSPFRNVLAEAEEESMWVSYDEEKEYPIIGLLDSGVDMNSQTSQWVVKGSGCNIPDEELDTSHGTFIATLLIHGNRYSNYTDCSVDGCRIVDVPIVPRYSIPENELINNIRDAISNNPEVKIWNLSVSLVEQIDQNSFSTFAIALDEIQDEFKVLICKSAGNDRSFYAGSSAGIISKGAESLRSLTVGSILRNSDNFGFCKKGFPAPYSRIGRGPANIIKPEVVHFGGDVFALNAAPTSVEDYQSQGETSYLNAVKRIEAGTSFSTPKIAKSLSEINNSLIDSDLLLSKTLLIHSSTYFNNPDMKIEDKIKALGFGYPKKSSDILVEDTEYRTTMILKGELRKSNFIDIMSFPFPKNLLRDGHYYGKIKITLCYDNILDKRMASEYSQSNITLRFGTFEKIEEVRPFANQKVPTNPFKRIGSKNVLLENRYSVNSMRNNTEYASERKLIKGDFKYHSTKQYSIDLSETKPSKLSDLESDKSWFLYMSPEFRNPALDKYSSDQLKMNFCCIITIEDPFKENNIYEGV
ncbi:TPA: S8 family serine peptidase, partial [Enterococcus faecium]